MSGFSSFRRGSGKAGDGSPSRAFSRARRLLRASDYGRVFAQPLRAGDRYFQVLARPRPDGGSRLGLAIAKKQLRRAVDRNRIKRLAREFFRTQVLPKDGPALDFVVMARAAAREADNATLRQSLARQVRRLRERAASDSDSSVT